MKNNKNILMNRIKKTNIWKEKGRLLFLLLVMFCCGISFSVMADATEIQPYTQAYKQSVVISASGKNITYGQSGQTGYTNLSVSGNMVPLRDIEVSYIGTGNTNYSQSSYMPKDVGTYRAMFSVSPSNPNYEGSGSVEFSISKASISPKVSITGWTYGENPNTPKVTSGNPGNANILYSYAAKGSSSYTETVPSKPGQYVVKAEILETNNYTGGSASKEFTIAKAQITDVVLSGKTFTFNGENINPEVRSVRAGSMELNSSEYTVSGDVNRVNYGNYKLVVTARENSNYKGSYSVNWEITRKEMNASASNVTAKYDGNPVGISVSVNGPDISTIQILYGTTPTNCNMRELTFTDVGTYQVYYKVTAKDYKDASGSATVQITPADITNITISQTNTLTYNGKKQTPEFQTTAFSVNNQPVTFTYSKEVNGNYEQIVPSFKDVSTNNRIFYKVSAPNHAEQSGFVDVVMSPLAITVKPDPDQTKIYGDEEPEFTYTCEGLLKADEKKVTGFLSRIEGEDVTNDGYEYTIGTLDAGMNYELVLDAGAARFIIEPKSIIEEMVFMKRSSFLYDGNEFTPDITVKALGNELVLNTDYRLKGDLTGSKPGEYSITVIGKGNYTGEVSLSWLIDDPEGNYRNEGSIFSFARILIFLIISTIAILAIAAVYIISKRRQEEEEMLFANPEEEVSSDDLFKNPEENYEDDDVFVVKEDE